MGVTLAFVLALLGLGTLLGLVGFGRKGQRGNIRGSEDERDVKKM